MDETPDVYRLLKSECIYTTCDALVEMQIAQRLSISSGLAFQFDIIKLVEESLPSIKRHESGVPFLGKATNSEKKQDR